MATVSYHGWMVKRWKDFFSIFCALSQVFTFRHRFHWIVHTVCTQTKVKNLWDSNLPCGIMSHSCGTTQKMASSGHTHSNGACKSIFFFYHCWMLAFITIYDFNFSGKSGKHCTNYGKNGLCLPHSRHFSSVDFSFFCKFKNIFIYCCDAFSFMLSLNKLSFLLC